MRSTDDIEAAIRAVMSNRAKKTAERDRQEQCMRAAMLEVERLEHHMARDLDTIEALYDDLDQARQAEQLLTDIGTMETA